MDLLHQLVSYLKPEGFRALVQAFGLPLVCAFVFAESGVFPVLPGDSLLVVCGMFAVPAAAGAPVLSLWSLLVLVPICAVAGSQLGYEAGRWAGARAYAWPDLSLGPLPLYRKAWVARTEGFFKRWGAFSVVAGRWVPFARTFTPLLAGVARVARAAYVPFNVLGAVTWTWTMVLTGYWLPPLVDRLLPGYRLEDHIDHMVLAVVALSVLPLLYTYVKERSASRAPAPAARAAGSARPKAKAPSRPARRAKRH